MAQVAEDSKTCNIMVAIKGLENKSLLSFPISRELRGWAEEDQPLNRDTFPHKVFGLVGQ